MNLLPTHSWVSHSSDHLDSMTEDRLPTHIWVGAFIRRCSSEAIPVTVLNSGEKMGGTVLFKVYNPPDACRLLSQMRNPQGNTEWYQIHKQDILDEVEASSRVRKAIERDPDLWVIEVETRDCKLPFEPF